MGDVSPYPRSSMRNPMGSCSAPRSKVNTEAKSNNLAQLFEEVLRGLQVGGLEPLGEAVVNQLENFHRVGGTPLTAQKPGKAESAPQLPEQGALLARHLSRSSKAICRCLNHLVRGLPQQHLALDAEQFGDIPLLAVFPSPAASSALHTALRASSSRSSPASARAKDPINSGKESRQPV